MIEKNLNYDKIDYFDIDEVHSSGDSDNNLLEKVFFKSIENKEYNIFDEDKSIYEEKTQEMTRFKKRGRPKKSVNSKKEHTKYFFDNQIAKILVHVYKFIIILSNAFLKSNNIHDKEFNSINGGFTKKRDLNFLKQLIKKPIKFILEQNTSEKFGKKEHNKELMKNLEENDKFKEFFNMNFKYVYSEIFLKNNNNKLLNDFGIKSKLKMLDDFLILLQEKNEQQYIDQLKETCKIFISHIESTTPKIHKKKQNNKLILLE